MRAWGLIALALLMLAAPAPAEPPKPDAAKAKEAMDAWKAASDDAAKQVAGKRVMKEAPEARETFDVVKTFLEKGWPVGKIATSYETLKSWTYDRFDGKKNPDLRLGFLDVIEKNQPTSSMVVEGGIGYARCWCHYQAGRYAESIEVGEKYVSRFPKGGVVDEAHLVIAQSMLALSPPDLVGAKKHLKAILAMEKTDRRAEAERLLAAAESGGASIQATEGFPRPEGLGKIVALTNLAAGHPLWKALDAWRAAKKAEVVRFEGNDVAKAAADLRKIGPEFVAVVVEPTTVDVNFHLDLLEMCRNLDADPMPDFHFGYLTARTRDDLEAYAARVLLPRPADSARAGMVAITPGGESVKPLDFVLHFGHGNPWSVVDGATGEQISAWALTRHPVVFSGACFNAVLSRSTHASLLQPMFLAAEEVPPERLVSLSWIHAGADGFFASLDGDRGEMAMAEWARFQEGAEPLGAVIGYQYRLAFTSLPESYPGFPRYRPHVAKRMGFYDVMLRGMVARLLLGDPSYRPLAAPLADPTTSSEATLSSDGATVTVTAEVLRFENGPFVNYLPEDPHGNFDSRLYARVELPGSLGAARLDAPTIGVESGGALVPYGRSQIRHEVWGGRRFVDVQVESTDGRLARRGTRATFAFPVRR